jgi:Xaa-Pro aminopeptidase
LARLRGQLHRDGLDGFLVPRADAHQGEYVAARDARLSWLTGFTGSAGFCVALKDRAGVFVDGRYRLQVKQQVDACFTPVDWPETELADWLLTQDKKPHTLGLTHGFTRFQRSSPCAKNWRIKFSSFR